MVGGDEPQLQVQVVVPLLHTDEVEDIVVLHAIHTVDLILVLPGELVLEGAEHGKVSGEVEIDGERQGAEKGGVSWYLDGKDLHGHILAQQLRLPHTAEAPPGLYLNELQGLVSKDGGGRRWSGVLRQSKGVCRGGKGEWDLNN